MANVIEFTIKGDSTGGTAAMDKMRLSLDKVVKAATIMATVFATAFGVALKSIIDVGSKTENLRIRLNALLGSTKEGGKAFDEMAKFAATVPFAFDEIMEASTTLAGVVKGGVNEISRFMPIIADLATVSGLTIQETTGQVQRMFSAGAGAADLFRERGITAMLGFEAGVAVSADESKRRLIEAFEDPASKFRDASKKMATTWDGVLSMIGDKWFTFKSNIADEGIFNFIKAIAITIDTTLGKALADSANTAGAASNFMVESLRTVGVAVGWLADIFRGLRVVWKSVTVLVSKGAEIIIENIIRIVEGWRKLASIIPGIDLGPMESMRDVLTSVQNTTADLTSDLTTLAETPMPGGAIKEFMVEVEDTFTKLNQLGEVTAEAIKAPLETLTEFQLAIKEGYTEFLTELGESNTTFATSFFDLMTGTIDAISDSIGQAIVQGESLSAAFKGIGQQVLSQLISMFVKLGIQRMVLSQLQKTAVASEASAEAGKAIGIASANGVASMAAAPFPINTTAPAFGAAMGAAASAQFAAGAAAGKGLGAGIAGIAHGGLTNVPSESTFLLDKGERVLSPGQNKDFTDFISGGESESGGSVVIENLTISILENATNADALLNMDKTDIEEIVAGPIITALNKLNTQGIRPDFIKE